MIDTIDWTVHGRAINRHAPRKNTLVKYLHNILPVGEVVHRYNPKYPRNCPSCNQDHENQKHLLVCQAASRKEWRCLTVTKIRRQLDAAETNLELMTIALDGIQSVLTGSGTLDHHRYPAQYRQLVEEQEAIGWTNFLKGRLTTQWAIHQDRHLKERKLKTSKRNGTTWATNLASAMLNEWLALWKIRNEDRHGRDKTTQTRVRAEQIRREVELLYEQADQAPPNYSNHIYRHDLETQLDKTTAELIGWLSNWAPVVHQHQQYLKQQQHQLQQQQQQQQQTQPTASTNTMYPATGV